MSSTTLTGPRFPVVEQLLIRLRLQTLVGQRDVAEVVDGAVRVEGRQTLPCHLVVNTCNTGVKLFGTVNTTCLV